MSDAITRAPSLCSIAQLVMQWPAEFAARARSALLRLSDVSSLNRDEMAEFGQLGLVDGAGNITPAGECLVDLVVHESWQADDELPSFLQRGAERLGGDVLDVGCSTGWTLRHIRDPMPRSRIGIDVDERALALGRRLAEAEGQEITFMNASAHELPFPDLSFDWVICRNAISYTHQRSSIREMTRVLRPRGYLFLRFENLRYDLQLVAGARGPREAICRVRDLAYGVLHTLTGVQPTPGSLLRGGRAMGSVRRLTKFLRANQLDVIETAGSQCCPVYRGQPNQTSLLSRKHGALAVAPREDTLQADGSPKMVRR